MKNVIIGFCLVLTAGCCSVQHNNKGLGGKALDNSVVSLVHQVSNIDYTSFPPEEGEHFSFGLSWQDYCSAVAVSATSGTMLVTAAHCMPKNAGLGTEIRYVATNGWGHDKAIITWIDNVDDLVVLEPNNAKGLVPLHITNLPEKGTKVVAISSIFGATNGKLVAELSPTRVETNLTIEHGWSGSPVISKDGVFGIVVQCQINPQQLSKCTPGYASVALLPHM